MFRFYYAKRLSRPAGSLTINPFHYITGTLKTMSDLENNGWLITVFDPVTFAVSLTSIGCMVVSPARPPACMTDWLIACLHVILNLVNKCIISITLVDQYQYSINIRARSILTKAIICLAGKSPLVEEEDHSLSKDSDDVETKFVLF